MSGLRDLMMVDLNSTKNHSDIISIFTVREDEFF
jgi:hypothetical protein